MQKMPFLRLKTVQAERRLVIDVGDGKQAAAQLAEQHKCSPKTIRRHLAKAATQTHSKNNRSVLPRRAG